uniref:Serine/threonine-protein kinase RIO3 n=1 Tax=Astyanax mexicanus TaxID=7994 RepID=A0A8B9GZP9_ASTMX
MDSTEIIIPWGTQNVTAPPCSLADVMSEQLAKQLNDECTSSPSCTDGDLDLASIPQDADTSSDLMLAQMLQMEFDREFDTQLRREEKKFNGESKGSFFSFIYKKITPQFYTSVDSKTRLLMFKMVNAGILENINGCISTGKESVVFHADGGSFEEMIVPEECVLKVFKTTLNEFKNRDKYIKDDYRFKDRFSKLNPRKIIRLWAEKEMHNLARMKKAGIPCPDVVILKKHILVMSFIGQNQVPAPKLKEANLSKEDLTKAYYQVVQTMQQLYKECNLVHADLSEYNMLWHDGQVWLIDVSQSVEPTHPHGLEFLFRDCRNVATFFQKSGVAEALSVYELFNTVSGLEISCDNEADFLAQIEALEKMNEDHVQKRSKKVFTNSCDDGPPLLDDDDD